MNFKALFIVGLLLVFGVGAYVISDTSTSSSDSASTSNSSESNDTAQQTGPDIPVEPPMESFSMEEVAMHATEDDCWTIINDVVYDITPYVPRHPGGDEILRACGQDGSTLFNARRTEDGEKVGFGDAHSSRAAGQLAELVIGTLE